MVLDPIPQSLPVHFFGSRPQPPTSHLERNCACEREKEREKINLSFLVCSVCWNEMLYLEMEWVCGWGTEHTKSRRSWLCVLCVLWRSWLCVLTLSGEVDFVCERVGEGQSTQSQLLLPRMFCLLKRDPKSREGACVWARERARENKFVP